MPIQQRILRAISRAVPVLGALAWAALSATPVHGIEESSPMQWGSKHTQWDRKLNRVKLVGDAFVRQPGELLTADTIEMDLTTRELDAVGNCVYIASDSVIHGEEMHFNLETRTGTILGGRVSSEAFTLTGERINKLGAGRFQTHQGAYSTCRDCPQSWTLFSEDVDMEIEGYAYLTGVSGRVKDAPLFWLPYLIVPLKTQRQTGVLFPKFGFTGDGFRFVLPVFVTLGRSADMTIGLGEYGGRGFRGEWEGRYRLSGRSSGEARFFYLKDSTFEQYLAERNRQDGRSFPLRTGRWALDAKQSQELPWGLEQKLRILDVSDNSYPSQVGDIPGTGEAYISSDLIFAHSTNQVSSYVAAKRTRNLLFSNPVAFDPNTVQVYPTVAMTTNDKFLFGSPLAAGLTVGLTNFTRTGPAFDVDRFSQVASPGGAIRPGQDPIRKATRFFYTPRVYTTLRPWGLFSLVPSAEYRGYYYNFHQELPNLSRGYLQFKTDFSFQLERVYETNDPSIPRIKHLIRPNLSFSLIPLTHESYAGGTVVAGEQEAHPFLRQVDYARSNGFSGYNFDNYDIVPRDQSKSYSNYFLPQGKALTYGFTSQMIRRKGAVESDASTYQTSVELKAGQTYNFRSLREGGDQQPFSRFFSSLLLEFDKWNSSTSYTYVPYIPITASQDRHLLSTSLSYTIERSIRQRILAYERSFSVGFSRSTIGSRTSNLNGALTYSLNDYILPSVSASRDFNSGKWLGFQSNLRFQSPSQCWKFEVGVVRRTCDKPQGYCIDFGVDLALNLTGSGFGGVTDVAATTMSK